MRHFGRVVMVSAAVLLFAGLAVAQQKPKPAEPASRIVPLKVRIVLSEYDGSKKISSLPYTLETNAVTRGNPRSVSTQLRLGVHVPVRTGTKDFQYENVGTKIDCSARALGDTSYQLRLYVVRTSVSLKDTKQETQGPQGQNGRPLIRNFEVSSTLVLRDGQSDESTVATDPVSGHVLRVVVTLHVVKSSS